MASFAAPPMAAGGDTGGSADTGATLDTGSTVDTSTAVSEPGEGGTDSQAEPGESGDGSTDQTSQSVDQQPGKSLIENGKLTPSAKSLIESLQKTNPAEARQIKDALFLKDRLARELPGGIRELQTMRAAIDSLGGEQGLKDAQAELEGWTDFDHKWMAGDATVLDFLMQEDAGKEAFAKLAPTAFDRFAEINPAGWENYIAKQVAFDMASAELPMHLKLLAKFAPPELKEYLDPVLGYFNRIAQISQKQPATAPPGKPDAKVDADRQKFETERKQFTQTQWRSEVDKNHGAIFQKSWSSIVGDRKVTDVQRENINVLYAHELQRIIPKDFEGKMQRYLDAGQKDGYVRLHNSIFGDVVAKALRAAVNRTLPTKPGPAATQTQQSGKPQAKTGATTTKPGPEMVNAKPNMADVNRSLTTPDMWIKGEAVLKSGKLIKWNR